jgi:hypothetical protein
LLLKNGGNGSSSKSSGSGTRSSGGGGPIAAGSLAPATRLRIASRSTSRSRRPTRLRPVRVLRHRRPQ